MKYAKPPLTLEQQADQLLRRGMAGDRDLMIARLRSVSYYRLSGYWFPFRNADNSFQPGTSFETVWRPVRFRPSPPAAGHGCRRTYRSCGSLSTGPSPLAPFRPVCVCDGPRHTAQAHGERTSGLPRATSRRKPNGAVRHSPCISGRSTAIATDTFPFGWRLRSWRSAAFLRSSRAASPQGETGGRRHVRLARHGVRLLAVGASHDPQRLHHHGRLWNRELGVKPMIPLAADYPDWHKPVVVRNNRVFAVLTMCRWCLRRVAPQSRWADRLRKLLQQCSGIPPATRWAFRPTGSSVQFGLNQSRTGAGR